MQKMADEWEDIFFNTTQYRDSGFELVLDLLLKSNNLTVSILNRQYDFLKRRFDLLKRRYYDLEVT